MSQHRDEHLDLCAGLALGCLDPEDAREIERHLAEGCAICEPELLRLAGAATRLASAAPPAAPPPALRRRVLESVRRISSATDGSAARVLSSPTRRRSPAVWAWAAAAVLLAISAAILGRAMEASRAELVAARGQLETARRQLEERDRQLADAKKWQDLVEGGSARWIDLTITPQGDAVLNGRAVYDPGGRRAIIVFSHITPPAGSDYQLWALRSGKPESLGLIHGDANGRAVVRLPDTGDPTHLDAFAVSLEKAGGSVSAGPQGPVVMVGRLATP